jgi:hypothetical protein
LELEKMGTEENFEPLKYPGFQGEPKLTAADIERILREELREELFIVGLLD